MSELLPCPFCGGEADVMLSQSRWGQSYTIHHDTLRKCPAEYVGSMQFATEAEAIAAWNTRHQCGLTDEDYSILLDELGVSKRTCKCTTGDSAWCFVCSECGKSFPRNKLHLAHNHGEINYCPNCGSRVVDGKEGV